MEAEEAAEVAEEAEEAEEALTLHTVLDMLTKKLDGSQVLTGQ